MSSEQTPPYSTLVHDKSRFFVTRKELETPSEARERFRNHFLAAPIKEEGKQWSSLWDNGEFLPWDKLCASPALEDLMAKSPTLPIFQSHTSKRALVPGCGRGYDALVFAKHGYSTIGMDISTSAITAAHEWIKSTVPPGIEEGTINSESLTKMNFIAADFFDDGWLEKLGVPLRGAFELVYDYAFLVAMNPSTRTQWASRMAELITPGTGLLICLEYPLFREPESGGPPFAIRSTDYDALLRGRFEKMMHYMPARTHEVGIGSDMVSVWRRREDARL